MKYKPDWSETILHVVAALLIGTVIAVVGYGIWYSMQPQRTAEGSVAEKYYHPPYDEFIPAKAHESCSGIGQSKSCNTWYEPARMVHHNATFQLRVVEAGCPDIYAWLYVPEMEYNQTKIGDDRTFKTIWKRCTNENATDTQAQS